MEGGLGKLPKSLNNKILGLLVPIVHLHDIDNVFVIIATIISF